jgi:hypothetical protein
VWWLEAPHAGTRLVSTPVEPVAKPAVAEPYEAIAMLDEADRAAVMAWIEETLTLAAEEEARERRDALEALLVRCEAENATRPTCPRCSQPIGEMP